MSDQPTPTPPWERGQEDNPTTCLEVCIALANDLGREVGARAAWFELCTLRTRLAALERVAKAAAKGCINGVIRSIDYDELQAAIDAAKEQR